MQAQHYKALFLDMDETLCDTPLANTKAQQALANQLSRDYGEHINAKQFADDFLKGIYKVWTAAQAEKYQPIRAEFGEEHYRQILTQDLLAAQGIHSSTEYAVALHEQFEVDRMAAFDFFPGIKECLTELRKHLTLVVITNGPEFSQIPKIEAVNMSDYVDHIIIGGQEPEEKPALSIFEKAMRLAECNANETIHFGDSLSADIAGANNAGIESVWIQHGQPLNEAVHAAHTLAHPREMPNFIRERIRLAVS